MPVWGIWVDQAFTSAPGGIAQGANLARNAVASCAASEPRGRHRGGRRPRVVNEPAAPGAPGPPIPREVPALEARSRRSGRSTPCTAYRVRLPEALPRCDDALGGLMARQHDIPRPVTEDSDMAKVRLSTVLPVPARTVWDTIDDFNGLAKWRRRSRERRVQGRHGHRPPPHPARRRQHRRRLEGRTTRSGPAVLDPRGRLPSRATRPRSRWRRTRTARAAPWNGRAPSSQPARRAERSRSSRHATSGVRQPPQDVRAVTEPRPRSPPRLARKTVRMTRAIASPSSRKPRAHAEDPSSTSASPRLSDADRRARPPSTRKPSG